MDNLLIGNHPSIIKIRELVSMVSDMALNVLLLGETGTGKDVVARLLHSSSTRSKKRFIKVNCAALPLNLLESELFGYEKGAFTGADKLKPGKFELASGGVMFLDEIGDMPSSLQAKLLNVLQSGEYSRLGGTKSLMADSWVITATNHDLSKDIKEGLFREDLFYRLNIIKIELPPLRKRKEDIPALSDYFIRKNQVERGMSEGFTLDSDMKALFQDYNWPGNVRELASTVLRLMVGETPERIKYEFQCKMDEHKTASIDVGMPDLAGDRPEIIKSLKLVKSEASMFIEKKAISHVLDMTGGNKSETARILKISYKTLFNKMNELGMN